MLASVLLAGYGMGEGKRPSRFHMLLFPLVLATAVFVIIYIEFPRIGFVRIEKADHFLTHLFFSWLPFMDLPELAEIRIILAGESRPRG
jgi:hypothetical protein